MANKSNPKSKSVAKLVTPAKKLAASAIKSVPVATPVAVSGIQPSKAAIKTAPQTTPSRNRKEVTQEQIAKLAYEISQSGTGGSDFDNWVRAERQLRGE